MVEKRSYPRIEAFHNVLYSMEIHPKPTIGLTVDLSMGGAKIESLQALRKNERLKISIGIESQVIRCRGKVVYVSGPENGKMKAGIRFEELSKGDEVYLRQYLSYVMQRV